MQYSLLPPIRQAFIHLYFYHYSFAVLLCSIPRGLFRASSSTVPLQRSLQRLLSSTFIHLYFCYWSSLVSFHRPNIGHNMKEVSINRRMERLLSSHLQLKYTLTKLLPFFYYIKGAEQKANRILSIFMSFSHIALPFDNNLKFWESATALSIL